MFSLWNLLHCQCTIYYREVQQALGGDSVTFGEGCDVVVRKKALGGDIKLRADCNSRHRLQTSVAHRQCPCYLL